MAYSPEKQKAFIRCTNCGEIMTGEITKDGTITPVGLGNGGKCGKGEFEIITRQEGSNIGGEI